MDPAQTNRAPKDGHGDGRQPHLGCLCARHQDAEQSGQPSRRDRTPDPIIVTGDASVADLAVFRRPSEAVRRLTPVRTTRTGDRRSGWSRRTEPLGAASVRERPPRCHRVMLSPGRPGRSNRVTMATGSRAPHRSGRRGSGRCRWAGCRGSAVGREPMNKSFRGHESVARTASRRGRHAPATGRRLAIPDWSVTMVPIGLGDDRQPWSSVACGEASGPGRVGSRPRRAVVMRAASARACASLKCLDLPASRADVCAVRSARIGRSVNSASRRRSR